MATRMLTTTDNPFNPFTEYRDWYTWDEAAGYHTCGLLARLTWSSNELSETDQALAVDYAIDEIIKENISGMHRVVTRETAQELLGV